MTYPEVLLWQRLRGHALGVGFRKQHPLGPYVVDFCCISARLVVEVDGAVHDGDRAASDHVRDQFIRENGFRVLRVRASDVARDIDGVVAAIVSCAARPLHHAAHGPQFWVDPAPQDQGSFGERSGPKLHAGEDN